MTRCRWSSTAFLLFATCVLIAATLHPGVVDNVDSRIILRTAERLIDAHTWSLGDVTGTYMASAEYGGLGTDLSHQMKFGPGTALLCVPFVLLGRFVLGPVGLDPHHAGEAGAAAASVLWFAASCVLVLRIARRVVGERTAICAALLHGFASYAIVYGRSAYLETPLTVFVLLAFDAALATRADPADARPAWILGVAAAAVVWIKLAAVLLLAGIPAILFLGSVGFRRDGVRSALRAAGPACVGVGLWCWCNYARFGNPFATGYSGSARFDHPLFQGIVELLLSERGGLLYFAPCALIGLLGLKGLARVDRGLAWGVGLAFAAALPLYAAFFSPFGGDAWGPRYLLPNVALLAVPAAALLSRGLAVGGWRRCVAATVVAWGVLLQAAPCVVAFSETWTVIRQGGAEPRLGVVAARIARAKLTSIDGTYKRAELGAGEGVWQPYESQLGPDLWPVRVAREIPGHESAAWAAWTVLAAGACACGVLTLRRSRSADA
ncbi:MAG: hypothetical protein K8T90_11880 [Planctomycetes bacterium]|nr:hypothetical protein [Planctomycetota bacterium]